MVSSNEALKWIEVGLCKVSVLHDGADVKLSSGNQHSSVCQSIYSNLQRTSCCFVSSNAMSLCMPSVSKVSEKGIKCAEKISQGDDIKYLLN